MSLSRRIGTISAVDEVHVMVRVRLPECDNLRTAWLPVLQHNTQNNKDYWLPDIGEQVEVLLDDNGEDGLVLGAIYSAADVPTLSDKDKRAVTFADGAHIEYDRRTHTLTINGGVQHIEISSGTDVVVNAQRVTINAPETTVTGKLLVQGQFTYESGMSGSGGASFSGDVSVSGNVSASGSVMDTGGNSNHHSH
ncbi:phage baseplate assembly protein V [Pectobacterium parmentieri]|uniref:phage baseplate assembly protein V n=1 Tax=Pectobacterium parmentieri TaxID=1905730 RepID=UPI000CDDCEE3|nr:phage baseplate assembly protein V [Pectobacterium parmentieri]AYH06320.1 phage baseplate assembly protein V [Pectobacterium parmentieri]AYH15139.1 phage baseplate assembly protein V [Pectobacterium parmentieri]AYH23839.1 phage baseplate assembly protein V [Pectobacterium parmentieri]MBN3176940.1 phage baseplate assembly protein V [Pectobacterium parmentieri]POW30642.1 baseplate protein [Pectobacterium parmentieri]